MAWTYQRRIKIIPGVYLNFNDAGLSMAFGTNAGNAGGQPQHDHSPVSSFDNNIFSADILQITSHGMQGIKEAILMSYHQRVALNVDLTGISADLKRTRRRLKISRLLLYGYIIRSIATKLKADIELQKQAIEQLNEQIQHCYVALDIEWAPAIKEKYLLLVEAFRQLMQSHKIWDVTASHYQDRVATRSSAATLVSRREVRFNLNRLLDIKSPFEVLHFQNANGADLYCYPGFIVMYSSTTSFAVIGFDELVLNQSYVRFTETAPVPADSKVIDRTWLKVNKDGSPDRRFNGNYQIPVVKYGEINFKTATGLNEEYECSNYEVTEKFARAFSDYQRAIL